MRIRRRRLARRGGRRIVLWLGILAVLCCFGVSLSRLRPLLEELAINVCQYRATSVIQQSINQELSRDDPLYDQLVTLEKDSDNRITAMITNIHAINQLKTSVVDSVYRDIQTLENTQVSIALGTLLQGEWFAQRGPKIPLKVVGLGVAKAEFISVFASAGINQTRHQILLEVTVDVTVLFPGGNRETQVVSQFPVVEAVLLGNVPESYTYIDDTESSLLGKINDYATNDTPS